MPAPHHLRHPAPHPPHRHTTRAPTPTSQHTPPDRHAPPARHTRPLHTHLTTPYLLPSTLYLYICTSHPSPTARSDPILSSPLHPSVQRPTPLPHALTPSSAPHSYLSTLLPTPLPHALTLSSAPHSHPSTLLPTPLPCTLRSPFRGKVCTPPPKASSNPPVEIFCPKRRRRLILNILPRRHRVDNSVSSSVHSEEKA